MNKKDFFDELNYRLRKISREERKLLLQDLEDQFEAGLMAGKMEKEVISALGKPKDIAEALLDENKESYNERVKTSSNIAKVIILVIALFFINVVFLLCPVVAIFGVFVSLFLTGIAFTISPLAWVVSIILGQSTNLLGEFFIVLTISSLGVLITIGMLYVGKFLYRMLVKYAKFNVRLIRE